MPPAGRGPRLQTLQLRPLERIVSALSDLTLFGYWVNFVPTADASAVTTVHQVLHVQDRVVISEANGQPQLLGGPVMAGEHAAGCQVRFAEAAHLTVLGGLVALGVHEPVRRFGQLPVSDGPPRFRVQWLAGRALPSDHQPPALVRTLLPAREAVELLRELNPLHALVLEYALHHRVAA